MSETDSAAGEPADPAGEPADADEKGPAAPPDKPVIASLDDAPEGFEPV